VRVEQLAPFQNSALRSVIASYPNLQEIVWAQEEPRNMGAWTYMEPRLRELTGSELPIRYIGRPDRASPAEGSLYTHNEVQAKIVAAAYAEAPVLPPRDGKAKQNGGLAVSMPLRTTKRG
jgi:2-oxoglutarate dehydrogenase E1 component